MKKVTVIASFLLGLFGFTAQTHAWPQEAGQEVKQKVTKKTETAAAQAKVLYKGSPKFVPIEGTSVSYATNTPQEVVTIGDVFYLNTQDIWLESANPHGPWIAARYVPEAVPAIVCSQLNADPFDPYQLCALPWSSEVVYTVWNPSQ